MLRYQPSNCPSLANAFIHIDAKPLRAWAMAKVRMRASSCCAKAFSSSGAPACPSSAKKGSCVGSLPAARAAQAGGAPCRHRSAGLAGQNCAQRATSALEHGRRGAHTNARSVCARSGRLWPGRRVRAQPPLVEQGDQVLQQQDHNDREHGDDCCVGVVGPPCRQGNTFGSPCRRQMPGGLTQGA